MVTISDQDAKLASVLLDLASDYFGNHGCNDFDLAAVIPSVGDRRELLRRMHDHNGDPEEFDPTRTFRNAPDFWLMGFMTAVLAGTDGPHPNTIAKRGPTVGHGPAGAEREE